MGGVAVDPEQEPVEPLDGGLIGIVPEVLEHQRDPVRLALEIDETGLAFVDGNVRMHTGRYESSLIVVQGSHPLLLA